MRKGWPRGGRGNRTWHPKGSGARGIPEWELVPIGGESAGGSAGGSGGRSHLGWTAGGLVAMVNGVSRCT